MIDIKTGFPDMVAYLVEGEMEEKSIIYLGGVEAPPHKLPIIGVQESLETNMENIIIHETIHIIIFKLTKDFDVASSLDNIDNHEWGWPISGPNIDPRTLIRDDSNESILR